MNNTPEGEINIIKHQLENEAVNVSRPPKI